MSFTDREGYYRIEFPGFRTTERYSIRTKTSQGKWCNPKTGYAIPGDVVKVDFHL